MLKMGNSSCKEIMTAALGQNSVMFYSSCTAVYIIRDTVTERAKILDLTTSGRGGGGAGNNEL